MFIFHLIIGMQLLIVDLNRLKIVSPKRRKMFLSSARLFIRKARNKVVSLRSIFDHQLLHLRRGFVIMRSNFLQANIGDPEQGFY